MALKYFNVINGITAGNITLDATTGNATVTNLAVTGNANFTTAANVALGSNSNVKLTGGSSGQYLQTDGSGNLSWQSISSATAIANGTSNVSIPAANGNVVVSVNGVANIATFTSNAVFRGSYGLTGIISQSNTAPSSPQNGDQWYNTFNGILFEYLDDGTSSQWVDISSLPLPNLSTSNASAVLNNVQSTGTYFPAFISSTANGNYALSSNTAFSANLSNGALIATTFVGALSGAATSATTAGTVTTAAQPNITSVGTLTSLGVTGNISAGNVSATTFTGALSGAATTAGTVTTNAQPNITSTGTLTSLTVTGNASAGNLSTSGTLIATGNATVGNLGTAGTINAFQTITGSQFIATATVSAPMVISSTTKVANLNADLLDGFDTSSVNIANTVVVRNSDGSFSANIITATLTGSATTAGTVTTAAQPNITSVGTLTSLAVTGNISSGNANLGNAATANFFIGSGNNLSNIQGANVTGTVATATTAGTVTTAAQPNITSVGTLTALTVTGNVSAGNVSATTFTGALTGNATGSAATVTTAAQPNITSVGTLTSVAVTGNVTAGNVYANSGTIGASLLTGTLTTAAQPNITSTGTLTSLSVTGNVAGGNLTTAGVLSVTGTGVSSIAGNLDMTSNTIINLATPTNSTDAATKQYVDDIAQGLHVHPSCNAATTTTLASISGGTITYNNGTAGVGATLTTTGTYTTIDGVTLSNGMRILVKNETTQANNGIYVRTSATVLTRATDFDSAVEIAGGDFTFVTAGTQYNSTGWVQIDEVTTVGTDPIVWEQFSGAGTYQAGTGLTLTGSVFSVNASQTQITSVGTLTGLNSSGTITAPAFTANTGVFTGNGNGLSSIVGANVTGTVSSATTAGTVTTAAQPNITSVGTLTSLGVTGTTTSGNFATAGNITASFLVSNVAIGTAPLTVTSTTRVNNLNVAQAGVADSINVAAGTGNNFIIFANAATGNVAELTSTGLTANLSNNSITATTFVGALSGAATSATTAGTVTTAAQPNITSVGTLTSLGVSGTITASAFTANTGVFTGNANGLSSLQAGNLTGTVAQARLANSTLTLGSTTLTLGGTTTTVAGLTSVTSTTFVGALTGAATSATTAGTVTTAAQPNITSVGTLTGLTVSGTTGISTATGYVSVGGTSQFNSFKYNQDGGALGGTVGNQVKHATYYSTSTNADYLEITNTRYANGGDWTTAGSRLQQKIDATWMGFIQFNGAAQGGITFGTGTSTAGPNGISGRTVMDSSGNFYPLADNSLTLGASGQRWSTAFATTVQTTTLTAGSNVTAGTITGNWSLSAGSRLTATYADIAEKYVADATYEPGTVLFFGGEQEVTLANTFDSTKVAGVVTTNPAYSMNAALEAEYVAEIALQGRVPCKVIGPIEKGDLMVSASNGHATANNDARAGTIIGKALENFNGDFGVIEVAVGRF